MSLTEIQNKIKTTEESNYKLKRFQEKYDEVNSQEEKFNKQLNELGFSSIEDAKTSLEKKLKEMDEFNQKVSELEQNINQQLSEIDDE